MGELPKKEWMESVQLVFDYFCERTPRSFVEARETSVIWNYKYAGTLSLLACCVHCHLCLLSEIYFSEGMALVSC